MKSKRGNWLMDNLPWIIISLIVLAIALFIIGTKVKNILQAP